MLKTLSYKRKFYALLAGMVLLLILAFYKSFQPTFRIVTNYYTSKEMTQNKEAVVQELALLQNRTQVLDLSIGKSIEKPELVQNEILNFLGATQNNITISSIEKLRISEDKYFRVYSNTLILKSDYNSLVKTIYDFENDFKYARIATLKFYTVKNRKTKKNELFNKIIFQNYEKNN